MSFLSWLLSSKNNSKNQSKPIENSAEKPGGKHDDEEGWVLFEDLNNKNIIRSEGLEARNRTNSNFKKNTTAAYTATSSSLTFGKDTALGKNAGDNHITEKSNIEKTIAQTIPTIKNQSKALQQPTPPADQIQSIKDSLFGQESDLQNESELEDDSDQLIDGTDASIASTIEPVRVSLLPNHSTQNDQPSTLQVSPILSTSLSSLVAAAAKVKAADQGSRDSFKTQPRTLQTLAQLKDKELKMKKMIKLVSRKQ